MTITTDQGKALAFVLIIGGALFSFISLRVLDVGLGARVVLALIGVGVLGFGSILLSASKEEEYERDVLE